METTEKNILLPLDYSDISPIAIGHAYHIARKVGANLHLRHWVKSESKIEEAENKMRELAIQVIKERGVGVEIHQEVAVGDFMKEISKTADSIRAMLVVIGTHGLQGMEHIVGTHAIRLIGSSEVPFLVVQEKPIGPNGYENIVVPMELQKESKQKLDLVAKMAKMFDSEIHIVSPTENDEFLQNALDRNFNYAKTFMENNGVKFTSNISEAKSHQIDKAVFPVVAERKADLIAITNWHDTKVLGLFGRDDTQDIIINKEGTPVLVINPASITGNFDLFGVNG